MPRSHNGMRKLISSRSLGLLAFVVVNAVPATAGSITASLIWNSSNATARTRGCHGTVINLRQQDLPLHGTGPCVLGCCRCSHFS